MLGASTIGKKNAPCPQSFGPPSQIAFREGGNTPGCPSANTFQILSTSPRKICVVTIMATASSEDERFLAEAITEARIGLAEGGIPIGAVLVHRGSILGRGHNQRVQKSSPILHAEMAALEDAGRLPAEVYAQCTLYSTLSPCPMCSGAATLFKIPRIVIGENTTFRGPEGNLKAAGVEVVILHNQECRFLMKEFLTKNPELWREDIAEKQDVS